MAKVSKVIIRTDIDPDSPRNWDNLGKIVAFHRRYTIGDTHNYTNTCEFFDALLEKKDEIRCKQEGVDLIESRYANDIWLEDIEPNCRGEEYNLRARHQAIVEYLSDTFVIMPVYMYDHSGISISTAPYSCPWDSGQVGWIYVSVEDISKEFGEFTSETMEKAKGVLEGEVKTYSQYLEGDVYWFEAMDENNEIVDSCGGYYGYSFVKYEIAAMFPEAEIEFTA